MFAYEQQRGTTFFLVNTQSRKVTPLPEADELAGEMSGPTLDMLMSRREVWRVPISRPFTKTVVRTKHDIGSIVFDGGSVEGYYVTAPVSNTASKLIHRLSNGSEQAMRLPAPPLRIMCCLHDRLLIQYDDGIDLEGSQQSHMGWVSTKTGRPIGIPSKPDSASPGDSLVRNLARGLVMRFVPPAVDHNAIGGPKLQEYEIEDLSRGKVVGTVKVPYPQGQDALMSISGSAGSNSSLFCIEEQETSHHIDKRGVTIMQSRLWRNYYGYRLGADQAVKLYRDEVPDLAVTSGNDWSTISALTFDGRFLVVSSPTEKEIEIVSLKAW